MTKLILSLFIALSLPYKAVYADQMMDAYRNQEKKRDANFKKNTGGDLREEYKSEFMSNELDHQPTALAEAPEAEEKPQAKGKAPVEKNSFSKEDASEMGRAMMQGISGNPMLPPGAMPSMMPGNFKK